MEIFNENEEMNKLLKDSNIQSIKVCLIGIECSGKTTFLDRIIYRKDFNNFKEKIKIYYPTISACYRRIFVKLKNKIFKLDLWDTSGQLNFFH